MEGLFVVLLIIFLLSSSGKKNKARVEAQRKQQGQLPAAPAKQPSRRSPAERSARTGDLRNRKSQMPAQAVNLPGGAARMASVYAQLKDRLETASAPAAAPKAAAVPEASPGEGLSRPGSLAASAPQGLSAFDDEGCLGGSLPHDHTEGESRAEHGRHIAAMKAREAEEAAIAAPRGLAGLDPRDLRRAVVISEILGKPRAYRRRNV